MKTLILQLAHLGDVFQTLPVMAALKRRHPEAELHLLTRAKFAAAAEGMSALDKHWPLDARDVLTPLIDERPALDEAMRKLDEFICLLAAEKFDRIINLSFSPFSSFLVSEVAAASGGSVAEIKGYTRFEDGYLSIPDDGSAYFYAQVGAGRPNRLHAADLFAYIAGVDLEENDWRIIPQHQPERQANAANAETIVVHVGAGSSGGTLSPSKWQMVIKGLLSGAWTGSVVLVGSNDEREIAERVEAISGARRPVNLVGRTSLSELTALIRDARLLIGGDSGPVQIASLVNTPVLHVSRSGVSFWEKGPRSKGSRIFPIADESLIAAEEIVDEAFAMISGRATTRDVIRVPDRLSPYIEMRPKEGAFEWRLLQAMYMGADFPPPPSGLFVMGLKRLSEANRLALEQIAALAENPANKTAALILDQSDVLMDQIVNMVPEIAPILRWFRAERLRIGPMPVAGLVAATQGVHQRLADVIDIYNPTRETKDDNVDLG